MNTLGSDGWEFVNKNQLNERLGPRNHQAYLNLPNLWVGGSGDEEAQYIPSVYLFKKPKS